MSNKFKFNIQHIENQIRIWPTNVQKYDLFKFQFIFEHLNNKEAA